MPLATLALLKDALVKFTVTASPANKLDMAAVPVAASVMLYTRLAAVAIIAGPPDVEPIMYGVILRFALT